MVTQTTKHKWTLFIYLAYRRTQFGIKRCKIQYFMEHSSWSVELSWGQSLQITVNVWDQIAFRDPYVTWPQTLRIVCLWVNEQTYTASVSVPSLEKSACGCERGGCERALEVWGFWSAANPIWRMWSVNLYAWHLGILGNFHTNTLCAGLQRIVFTWKDICPTRDTILVGQNKILVGHHQKQKVEFYSLLPYNDLWSNFAGHHVRPHLGFRQTWANFSRPLSNDRLLFAALMWVNWSINTLRNLTK